MKKILSEEAVLKFWYRKSLFAYLLVPFSWIFYILTRLRYYWLVYIKKPAIFNVPVIVIGNISLGGTGKTPLVEWLVQWLIKQGYHPGIVMRGFKGKIKTDEVMSVTPESDVKMVGDESLLLATKCQCPLVIGKKRIKAVQELLTQFPQVNIIVSDDGLQHYALARDVEIAVMDGLRRLGNGFCLPAGPLREPSTRLDTVDFVVLNGKALNNEWPMAVTFEPYIFQLQNKQQKHLLSDLKGKMVHAIAGIGHPDKFFAMLRAQGIDTIEHPFPDHHQYSQKDFLFDDNFPIVMTEKDAVKCRDLVPQAFVIPLSIHLPEKFGQLILRRIQDGQKITRDPCLPHMQATGFIREEK